MLDRAVWLILGVALGAVGSTYLHSPSEEQSPDQPRNVQVDAIPSSGGLVNESSRTPLEINPENSDGNRQPSLDLEDTVAMPASNLPAVYSEVIGSPQPKRLRAADRHAIFLTEFRDEVWASAMESGIRNYVSDNASNLDIVVEYFECRSEHCEIAGYAPPGKESDINQLKNGLRSSGWWMGGQSAGTTSQTIDGVDRFVIIFNRNVIWEMRVD